MTPEDQAQYWALTRALYQADDRLTQAVLAARAIVPHRAHLPRYRDWVAWDNRHGCATQELEQAAHAYSDALYALAMFLEQHEGETVRIFDPAAIAAAVSADVQPLGETEA